MPELMKKIQDGVPQLKGLKHSAMNQGNVRAFAEMGLDVLIGNSMLMLPAMINGATGCVDGPPNAAPEFWVEIWRAYQAGDIDAAKAAQSQGSKVTDIVREFGMHGVLKALLTERLGIDCGDPRLPTLPLTPQQREEVISRAAAIGVGRVAVAQSDD